MRKRGLARSFTYDHLQPSGNPHLNPLPASNSTCWQAIRGFLFLHRLRLFGWNLKGALKAISSEVKWQIHCEYLKPKVVQDAFAFGGLQPEIQRGKMRPAAGGKFHGPLLGPKSGPYLRHPLGTLPSLSGVFSWITRLLLAQFQLNSFSSLGCDVAQIRESTQGTFNKRPARREDHFARKLESRSLSSVNPRSQPLEAEQAA